MVSLKGVVLGGIADARNERERFETEKGFKNRELGLREEEIGLRKKQLKFQTLKYLRGDAAKNFKELTEFVAQVVENAPSREALFKDPRTRAILADVAKRSLALVPALGVPPNQVIGHFEGLLQSTPTKDEALQAKADETGATTTAQIEAETAPEAIAGAAKRAGTISEAKARGTAEGTPGSNIDVRSVPGKGLVAFDKTDLSKPAKVIMPEGSEMATSDLVDERGNIKNEASADIARQAASLVSTTKDALGNAVTTGKASQVANDIAARAEKIVLEAHTGNRPISIAAAVQQALVENGFEPPKEREFNLPPETMKELAGQNSAISRVLIAQNRFNADVLQSLGIGSNIKAGFDAVLGQIAQAFGSKDSVLFKDVQKARNNMRIFAQRFKQALINNPRFPVAEQERLLALVPDPDVWFKNPATALDDWNRLREELLVTEQLNNDMISGKKPDLPSFTDPESEDFKNYPSGRLFLDGSTGKILRKK